MTTYLRYVQQSLLFALTVQLVFTTVSPLF